MRAIIYFLKQIHHFSGKIVYVNLLAMTAIGLLDGVAILLLVPLISLSGIIDMGVEGVPILNMFQFMTTIPPAIGLPVILSIYVFIVIGQNILRRQINVKNTMIQHGFLRHMQIETYQALLYAKWKFFLKNKKSDFVNILTSEVARASFGAYAVLQFISSVVFSLIQIVLAFILSPAITIFVLLSGLILIVFNRNFLKRSLTLGNRNFNLSKDYLSGVTDQMNGIKDIKSNTLEQSRLDWFKKITKQIEQERINYTKLKSTSQLSYKVASAVLIAGFIYVAILLFNAQAAQLMLVIVIFSRLWPTVAGMQSMMEEIASTIPSFKAVISIQEECKNAKEFKNVENNDIIPLRVNDSITCKGIYFRYNQDADDAIKNFNLLIPANQMTALVGHSGAGKSTFIDILMGLNRPHKGEVIIDGTPLAEDDLIAWRKSISYVPQEPFLFHTSIRENLTLVKPDASDDELWEALKFSSAFEFVQKLPQGLDTVIGDRGIKLSGGERQRLVLARAILRKPSILILDEATSSLDTENEKKIQHAIERLKGKMTIIVIAHRLSTIRNADQVVVLKEGEIIEIGGYTQLAKEKSGVFKEAII